MDRSRHSVDGIRLTVVLVHDAFANLSSWNGAITILQESSCAVLAVTNPLRGLARDASYVASAVRQIDGPVLLAGHGYGGMVIANAASAAENVIGLVAIAALFLDEKPHLFHIVGGAMALAGVMLAQMRAPFAGSRRARAAS